MTPYGGGNYRERKQTCLLRVTENREKDRTAMKVEQWDVTTIRPYRRNPRVNHDAVDAVARSIEQFGFRQPIVVDEKGVIIAGHTRFKAAKKLGLKTIPVHVAKGLTPAQAKAYRIADNQTSNLAEWDYELLPVEIGGLTKTDINLSVLGFPEGELAKLLEPEVKEGLTDPDDVPAPRKKPMTKRGDLWTLGDHRLLSGDATCPDDVKRLMAGKKARMCFTDPPWNVAIGKDSNPRHRQREGLVNDDLDDGTFAEILSGFAKTMKSAVSGDVYCVLGASQWPMLDRCLRAEGYHWSATVIWVKDVFVLGRSKYHRRYEPIWYGWHTAGKSSFVADRSQDDVWEIPRPKRSDQHPTMKPVELVARAISNSSRSGDIILDPFVGSGTAVIACEQLARGCRAMEIDPKYCDVTIRRWERFTGQKAKRA